MVIIDKFRKVMCHYEGSSDNSLIHIYNNHNLYNGLVFLCEGKKWEKFGGLS